jgi:4-amino-4-deoxy-L-arabinose transferase-like glycosyltransferase
MKSINPIWGILLLFILFKLNHLFVPYFWDELEVYTKAALYMYDHQIGLLPSVLPPELSRGHPLLFTAIFALGYKILGPHVWVGHLIALIFSCCLLIALYKLGITFFNRTIALVSCLLLIVQPVFIAQSSMVLPEIMLALFCLLSLYSYLKNRYLQLAIFSSLAILVKEPAIALPCVFFIIELYKVWRDEINKRLFHNLLMIISPLFTWGAFLLIQKLQNGWFFFPLHADYVSFSLQSIIARFGYYLSFLLKGQGRYIWTVLILIAILIYWFNANSRKRLPSSKSAESFNTYEILGVFTLYIFMSFAVLIFNFHLARYILMAMPVACLIVAFATIFIFERINSNIYKFTLIASVLLPLFNLKTDYFNVDADLGYLDIVDSQKAMTSFLDDIVDSNTIVFSDFPFSNGLADIRSGYTTNKSYNTLACNDLEKLADNNYLIYTIIGNLKSCKKLDGMNILKEDKTIYSKIYIYDGSDKSE